VPTITFGQTAQDVARGQYCIHPELFEVVENLLLALPDPDHAG
jgi:mycothione reductase